MGSSGPPTLDGGAQSISLALLRSNSSLSGGSQSNPMHSQQQFSNLVSPRTQFNCNNDNNSMNILGNIPNVSSLMNQSMGNGANLRQLGSAEPDPLSMNQQFSVQQQQQQQQQQQVRGVLGNVGQMDQNGSIRNMSPKRGLGPVKLEQQHSDPSMFLQQQQMLQMPRQNPQAALQNLLQQQQQRLMQQQILKGLPQLAQLQQQQQLQLNLPLRSQLKTNSYEPGLCARRLTLYICEQKRRPEDNDVNFWRNFVSEFFAPNAKKRWCVSFYGTGRQTTGVFPQDVWHCEICKRKPGRGFETTAEVLPRLCSIKYDSGTLEELLYVDMPHETQLPTGQIVLDYPKAIQESVFEQLRVVRDGHLRIIFNSDLKISSWEFCARKHEELIPRRLIIPQMSQLGAVVQKYQNAVQNASSGLSTQDLQNSCNSFVASACHVAKSLEVPLVNDLGYTKRYVRCLQISEVVNSMKDLMDYSRETGTGPMQSLINFPRRNFNSGLHPQQEVQQPQEQHQAIAQNSNPRQEPQQPQEQHHAIAQNSIPKQEFQQPQEQHQAIAQNSNHNDPNSTQANIMQLPSCNNDIGTVSYSVNGPSLSTTPTASLLQHQNSMNPRQSSSGSLHHSQHNPSSPFSSPTMQQQERQPTQPHEPDPSELIQEMMSLPSHNGAGLLGSNGMRGNPGLAPPMNVGGMEFGNMGGAGPTTAVNGLRVQMLHNAMGINGRVGMNRMPQNLMGTGMNLQLQQQDMGNRLLGGGMGSVNNFNYFHFN